MKFSVIHRKDLRRLVPFQQRTKILINKFLLVLAKFSEATSLDWFFPQLTCVD